MSESSLVMFCMSYEYPVCGVLATQESAAADSLLLGLPDGLLHEVLFADLWLT